MDGRAARSFNLPATISALICRAICPETGSAEESEMTMCTAHAPKEAVIQFFV
jgi:hypothetical protein